MSPTEGLELARVALDEISREIARRLRENDHRGEPEKLYEAGAKTIEDLLTLLKKQSEFLAVALLYGKVS